ncbi:MAG: DsbA family protein [Desulfobacterales bacterium]|nr:DsbA family protein [Desulfobacterales bacterium]
MTGRIEKLKNKFLIEIRWTAFPLHPETPADGLLLTDLFAGRSVDIHQMMTRLKQVAGEEGLPLGDRTKTYNSRLAQELGKWAEEKGKGEAYHQAVFHAYFADGRNIGDISTLLDLVKGVGLPLVEATEVLQNRTFQHAVDRDWARSKAMGVTAVPTFFFGGQSLVGAQPYLALERLVGSSIVR